MTHLRFVRLILVIVFFISLISVHQASAGALTQEAPVLEAADSASSAKLNEKTETEKFNPGEMIMEHVVDNHEWHILSLGHFNLTIPLPVLLWSDGKFTAFWSGKFHNEVTHALQPYKGFVIAKEGSNKGKITTLQEQETGKGPKVFDFSITKTVFAIFLSSFFLILIFVSVANRYKKDPNKAPSGLQNLVEPLILFIRDDVAKSSIGEKKYEKYLPYLLTIFFFIFFNNILGIVPFFPGGANVTGNIAVTGVMAAFTLIITTISGNRHYWIDIINTPGVPWWLKLPIPLMPIVEFIGIITKPFVLMVRLFANMTAGHIIILGFISIIFIFGQMSTALGLGVGIPTLLFMIFMDLLELLVAFIQAYVFTLLSALYFGLATIEPEHH
ncbi:MAG: F0F1 ATP synthase subunit A [Bacteroidetes bacterium]|nr:F0F1 ATP synthase subunit A [Bacteroidota bacterium]